MEPGQRLRRGAKPVAAMHDHNPLGQLSERQRPVDRRIAAAGDDDALAAKIFTPPHQVEDATALVSLDAGERWAIRPERAATGRDHHRARRDPHPGGIGHDKPVRRLAEFGHRMAKMVDGRERRRLLDEPIDEQAGVDPRMTGDVVDRFFRIERGALPARHVERVEHMAAHLQHAALEHREEPDRAGADDRDVGMLKTAVHRQRVAHIRACRRLRAGDTRRA